MDNAKLTKTPMAAAVSLALGLGGAQLAQAQGASGEEEILEEVLVYGIRSSLRRAMDFKRDTAGVVDAITAEDIGVFPDSNLAESLQRITGVSIDRERGEGTRITVRGLGPDFNLVTLNGRQLPTSGLGFARLGRSFDFANLASENIAAVEVYKTGQADVPSGGMGATINIRTTRPLDAPGIVATAAATSVNDASTQEGKEWTPQLSGLFSGTFLDDKIGVALSATYTERHSGLARAYTDGWRDAEAGSGLRIPLSNEGVVNPPEGTDIYAVPVEIGYNLNEYEQRRLNGQLTLQYQPIDDLTITLDHTLATYEVAHEHHNFSAWFSYDHNASVWRDGPVASVISYTEDHAPNTNVNTDEKDDGGDFSMAGGIQASRTELNSSGLNLLWDATDRLQLALDVHTSTSESEPDSKWGHNAAVGTASYIRRQTTGKFGHGRLPVLDLELSQPLSPDQMIVTGSLFMTQIATMDVDQAKLSGSYEFDTSFIKGIDFGVQITEMEYRSADSNVQRETWGGTTLKGQISDLAVPANLGDSFDQFAGSSDPTLQMDYYQFDMEALIARMEALIETDPRVKELNSLPPNPGPCGTGLCPSDGFDAELGTTEDSAAAYFQVRAETEWRGHPIDMRLGMRYEETKVTSIGPLDAPSNLRWPSIGEIVVDVRSEAFADFEEEYDLWLPNFDLRMNITDDLIGRLSLSRTLTRPNFNEIQGSLTVNTHIGTDFGGGNLGNPGLLPYRSKNVDLSFEYYYSEDSYVSAGYFHKGVQDFIGRSQLIGQFFPDLRTPVGGALWLEAEEALEMEGNETPSTSEIRGWIIANKADSPLVMPDVGQDGLILPAPDDPVVTFRVGTSINDDSAVTIDGVELAWQHSFGESGFGFILNATMVGSDAGYDNRTLNADQFVIPGLSDSANVIAFYDKNDISVRLTYNWRDSFLAGEGQPDTGEFPPTYVDEYKQWDLSASYWLTDEMQISLDVINLTDETRYTYGRSVHQVLNAEQTGTRYHLNFRYKFSN